MNIVNLQPSRVAPDETPLWAQMIELQNFVPNHPPCPQVFCYISDYVQLYF